MKHIFGLSVLFGCLLLLAHPAGAEFGSPQMGGPQQGPMPEIMEKLNLSADQKEQLRELRKKRMGEEKDLPRKRMGETMQKLNHAVARGATKKELSEIITELEETANEASSSSREFRSILTDAQREKFDRLMEEKKGERREMVRGKYAERIYQPQDRRRPEDQPRRGPRAPENENPLSDF